MTRNAARAVATCNIPKIEEDRAGSRRNTAGRMCSGLSHPMYSNPTTTKQIPASIPCTPLNKPSTYPRVSWPATAMAKIFLSPTFSKFRSTRSWSIIAARMETARQSKCSTDAAPTLVARVLTFRPTPSWTLCLTFRKAPSAFCTNTSGTANGRSKRPPVGHICAWAGCNAVCPLSRSAGSTTNPDAGAMRCKLAACGCEAAGAAGGC
mmetsp:Transcript_5768/g.14032  ORF Transcript_5768/g.14032 Transcript_5768/m.14032 type:complete len:208 (-) Transcript_5768:309-932(-)